MFDRKSNPVLEDDVIVIREILREKLKGYKVRVYPFGSRAQCRAGKTSDLDVAILSLQSLPPGLIAKVRGLPEESNVPFEVDVVDLAQTDALFRERVRRRSVDRLRERPAIAQVTIHRAYELLAQSHEKEGGIWPAT